MRLPIGAQFGAYEIKSILGAGGMGEVYRAHDTTLGRDVAIKLLSDPFTRDPERLARFDREARTLASLNHPCIGAIYGVERIVIVADQLPAPALILELVEGDTLADRLRRGPIPTGHALAIAHQLIDALEAAHERGVVHRDLKPANIKVRPDDAVKVLDFGLAKALASGADAAADDLANSPTITSEGTRDGVILGTAAYMSPEQARGQPVDKRADIWAFGCVVYEMLTGARAFPGQSVSDTLASILAREPDWTRLPPETSAAIRRLLRRCLEKDAKRRLRDISDARIDFDDAAAAPEPSAPIPSRPRMSWIAWGLVALALAAGVSAGSLLGRARASSAPTFDRMIRIVSTPAHEFAPVISPDGKWVAYLSDARGPTDVWVKFIAGGDPVNLTGSTRLTVQSQDAIGGPAISPDGSQISFVAQMEAGLAAAWVIPAPMGGPPRQVLPRGSSLLQWAPNGKRIAYIRTGGPLGDAIVVADVDGQNETEVIKRAGGRHVHWIRWSPDARFLYFNYGFQNFNSEPTEIGRVAASGGAVETVVATTRRAVSPYPSPDGRGLLYAANPDGADLALWWKDLQTGQTSRVTTGIGEYYAPSMSVDGRRLVGTVVDIKQTLERVAIDGPQTGRLEPVTNGFSGDLDPAWSPDGSRLLFSSSRTGNRALWTMRSDFTQASPLTGGTALDERPVYSPDGRQVAFVSDRGGQRGIWIVSADIGTPRLVAQALVLNTISWSPDGQRLVFSTPRGDAPGLMVLNVATGQITPLPTAGPASTPAWAPREDVIADVEPRGGTTGSFLRFVRSTGEAVPFAQLPLQIANGFVAWSPDGRRLAAVALPGATGGAVWVGEPASAASFRKIVDLPPGSYLRGITWSPDGSSLVLGRIQARGDIFLAER